jgi:steroid delta-isomerase
MSTVEVIDQTAIAQLIDQYFAATQAMDVEAWLSTFADDAIDYDPVGGEPLQGKAVLAQFFHSIADLFDQIGLFPDFVHIVGHEVAVKWTGRGRGKNGRHITFEGIDLFEINAQGKIQTLKAYWHPAAMVAELQADGRQV